MTRGLQGLLLTLAIAIFGYSLYRFDAHFNRQPVPAVVARTADAHRAVSNNLDARIERFLHDHPTASSGTEDRRLVALTFDDGPFPVETPLLLDVLHDLHVPATFFLIGDRVMQFPELTERIERDGHEIANHTMTHPAHFEDLSEPQVVAELNAGADAIDRYVTDPAVRTMMRPPHGRYTEETVRAAQHAGYHVILWNDDPGDWRLVAPQTLADHIETNASAPDIILLHSGRMATIEMLPEIVARFEAAGFRFVTVGDLMRRLPVWVIDHPDATAV